MLRHLVHSTAIRSEVAMTALTLAYSKTRDSSCVYLAPPTGRSSNLFGVKRKPPLRRNEGLVFVSAWWRLYELAFVVVFGAGWVGKRSVAIPPVMVLVPGFPNLHVCSYNLQVWWKMHRLQYRTQRTPVFAASRHAQLGDVSEALPALKRYGPRLV